VCLLPLDHARIKIILAPLQSNFLFSNFFRQALDFFFEFSLLKWR